MFVNRKRTKRPGAKLLGLDLGERWLGVAVTDDTGVLAAPVDTIDLRRDELDSVVRFAEKFEVAGIVAGLPQTLSGQEGFQARKARDQVEELRLLTNLPIVFWDERMTSQIADQLSKRHKKRAKTKADAIAAAIMLQSYVDANPFQTGG